MATVWATTAYGKVDHVRSISAGTLGRLEPDRFEGNRRIDALTQWFDIGPTVLELAEVHNPTRKTEAQSLLPFLENRPDADELNTYSPNTYKT